MKKRNGWLAPLGFLALAFSLSLIGCNQNLVDRDPSADGQNFFVLKDVRLQVLSKVDPQILNLVVKDLVSKGRETDAFNLKKTYDFSSGGIFPAAAVAQLAKGAKIASDFTVSIDGHSENIGWRYNYSLGEVVGTTGEHLQLEAFRVNTYPYTPGFYDQAYLRYRAHVGGIGWQWWKAGGATAGTEGEHRPIEAIQFSIDQSFAGSVYYRAHVAGIGWLDWVGNYGIAGTTGQERKLEAFQLIMAIY